MTEPKEITYVSFPDLFETKEGQHVQWRKLMNDRQLKEIAFDKVYAADYSHGTDGHNARLIIAKLAAMLDTLCDNITFYDADKPIDVSKPFGTVSEKGVISVSASSAD